MLSRLQFQGPGDLSQWKGVRLAGHFHQQGAEDGERERQLKLNAQAAAGLFADSKIAAHAPDHVLHHVEADAAAGDLGDGFLEREARQEQELEQLGLGELFSDGRRRQFPFQDRLAHALRLDAGAVVGDRHQQHAGAVAGFEADGALGGFAGALALLGRFAAVIHGVAQQVSERTFQSLQDVAIHLGILADDFEPHLLADGSCQVAHHAGKAADPIAERPHPGAQHFEIHALRKVRGAAVEQVQLLQAVGQKLLAAGHFVGQLVKLLFCAPGQIGFTEALAQVIQLF